MLRERSSIKLNQASKPLLFWQHWFEKGGCEMDMVDLNENEAYSFLIVKFLL